MQHLHRLEQSRNANRRDVNLLDKFDQAMARFLSVRVALNEPSFVTSAIDMIKTSSVLLCHYGLTNDRSDTTLRAPQIALSECQLRMLSCFPEFILQNISDFLMFNRRYTEGQIEPSVLSDLQSFFIMFMPYKERIANPHLRAKLAESLELTLAHDDLNMRSSAISSKDFNVQKIEGFKKLQLKNGASFALIKLFVDIEQSVSGDEMHFEQKFSYRRPMLKMLEIMWEIPDYKKTIQKLAETAVENIEAASVPVFIRFINLLLNDSIFLLDEAMQFILQIRNMDRER